MTGFGGGFRDRSPLRDLDPGTGGVRDTYAPSTGSIASQAEDAAHTERGVRQPKRNALSRSGFWGAAMRWLRRWPYVTASVIGVAIWFATSAILARLIPAAWPVTGWVGYLLGVAVGTPLAGLRGTQGWVVVPVITLALGIVLGGSLAVLGVHLS